MLPGGTGGGSIGGTGGTYGGTVIVTGGDKVTQVSADPVQAGGNAALVNMYAAPVVSAITAVTGLVSAYQAYEAGEDAKDIAAANAALIRAETEEQARIMAEENARMESRARARAAASGLSGASTELYLSALIESGRQDIDWLRQVGASKESTALSEGRMAYHQARAAMWGNIGSSIASAASVYRTFSV